MKYRKELSEFIHNLSNDEFAKAQKNLDGILQSKLGDRMEKIVIEEINKNKKKKDK